MLWDVAVSTCHKHHLNWRCETPQQLRSDGDVIAGRAFSFFICSLLNDTVSRTEYIALNIWLKTWFCERFGHVLLAI